ncbi:hypothetical protein, partial [Mixta theicola]|uniref:hypothetical protein n=1 Tax=Mixta theicola TaxID=1458355 RepID=UPI0024E0A76F
QNLGRTYGAFTSRWFSCGIAPQQAGFWRQYDELLRISNGLPAPACHAPKLVFAACAPVASNELPVPERPICLSLLLTKRAQG